MIHRVLTRSNVAVGGILWWVVAALLVLTPAPPLLTALVVVPFVLLAPGLCITVVLGVRKIALWGHLATAVGVSILTLMVTGLLLNASGPHLGIVRPLDAVPVFVAWSGVLGALALAAWMRFEPVLIIVPRLIVAQTARELSLIAAACGTLLLAACGAIRLTNGAPNTLTLVAIGALALVAGILALRGTRMGRTTVPLVLYLLALALLFMTSLRGSFIAGHDSMREFFVFDLTYQAGLWSMAAYRDAYNACLSITILPTMLANLSHLAQPYVYKVLYPIIFALTPGIVYLTSRAWVDRRLAILGAVLFLAFPTFFQDMPFLARQEIAFLFFGLMVYLLFAPQLAARVRRTLFVLMGCGVVLSHYTTMYLVLALCVLVLVLVPTARFLLRRLWHVRFVRTVVLVDRGKGELTVGVVALLVGVGALWVAGITQSGQHLVAVFEETAHALGGEGGGRSFDVARLFSFARRAPDVGLVGYERDVVATIRAAEPHDTYDVATYAPYPFTILSPELSPPLGAGTRFAAIGAWLADLALFAGTVTGKLIELSVILGLAYALQHRVRVRLLNLEYYVLALVAVCLVLATALLPVLSNEYGLFRALQQALFVLAPFLAVGMVLMGRFVARGYLSVVRRVHEPLLAMRSEAAGYALAAMAAIVVLLYATGFVPQLVGGSLPAFHLANTGDDYRRYLMTDEERAAALWLRDRGDEYRRVTGEPTFVIQTDRFLQNKLKAFIQSDVSQDIYPGALLRGAHVVVGPVLIHDHRAAVTYGGATILYEYPIEFLDAEKNVMYTNGAVRVYR